MDDRAFAVTTPFLSSPDDGSYATVRVVVQAECIADWTVERYFLTRRGKNARPFTRDWIKPLAPKLVDRLDRSIAGWIERMKAEIVAAIRGYPTARLTKRRSLLATS